MDHESIKGLKKINDYCWEMPQTFKPGMKVPGRIYAPEKFLDAIVKDKCQEQIANVAFLPGIVKYSLAMPDIHWGYGFPIGGVAATDIDNGGVLTPGGVGFDINCGVRLLRTDLEKKDITPKVQDLVRALYHNVPCGVGVGGKIKINPAELKKLLKKGSKWAVNNGYGTEEDIEYTENNGCMIDADPECVSDRAIKRGLDQSGTLGSGNHFIEVQVIDKVFDDTAARCFGLFEGQVTVMIHSGSRGLGYQVCADYLKVMRNCPQKYGISVPDRQLVSAPVASEEGQRYLAAMYAAANYAWANRQCLMHLTRSVFEKVFQKGYHGLGMDLVYDVSHNIAKIEHHVIEGKEKTLCVHRKGATRAFPKNHPDIPQKYRAIGQPVIIPGDMGSYSYVMVGTERAMQETFGSICHGAGRVMSRTQAVKQSTAHQIVSDLEKKGILVMATGKSTIAEEAPYAYKDVNEVTEAVTGAGLARPVVRMKPLGVIKG
ncbi:MAG: RtcB family protein [Candidatus Ancaeobacter aquaticus]|nr:RtcB family protein [Candidatus Ancaeobacter aquaticus]